jgi:hypothetical protein
LKGAKLIPKGFGTWPLLSHFGPCWRKWGQVPNPAGTISTPFILKGAKLVPKEFGTWPISSKKQLNPAGLRTLTQIPGCKKTHPGCKKTHPGCKKEHPGCKKTHHKVWKFTHNMSLGVK